MSNIDKRNRLGEMPFHYRVNKDLSVFIGYAGKQVKILKGKDAEKFLKRIQDTHDEKNKQLIMAKVTGNFKRGNERKN